MILRKSAKYIVFISLPTIILFLALEGTQRIRLYYSHGRDPMWLYWGWGKTRYKNYWGYYKFAPSSKHHPRTDRRTPDKNEDKFPRL